MATISILLKRSSIVQSWHENQRTRAQTGSFVRLTFEFKKKKMIMFSFKCLVYVCLLQGICDGAGSIILASGDAMKDNNLKPLAKIIGYHISGQCLHDQSPLPLN